MERLPAEAGSSPSSSLLPSSPSKTTSRPPYDDEDPLADVAGAGGDGEKKALGVFSMVAVVYFLVCGGSYGTEDLGGSLPPLFGLLGILVIPWLWSLPVALITAELATAMPDASGFLLWSRRAFGPFVSFLDAWIMIVVVIIDQALYPLIFVSYIETLVELTWWQAYLINLGYILLCMIVNLLGVSTMGHFSKIFSALALLPFVIFVAAGFFSDRFDPHAWVETAKDEWDVPLYLSVLLWATCGFEYSGFLAGDVDKPRRTFPIVMIGSIFLMIATYFFPIAMAIAIAEDPSEITEGAYPALALEIGLGEWIKYLMIAGGLASTMGTYNAYLGTTASALRAQAEEGVAPSIFSAFPQYKSPIVAIIFFSLTTAALVLLDFSVLVEIESLLYCLHVLLLAGTVIRLRWKEPELERPFALPFGKIGVVLIASLPMLITFFNIGSLFYYGWIFPLISVGVVTSGCLLYLVRHLVRRRWEYHSYPS